MGNQISFEINKRWMYSPFLIAAQVDDVLVGKNKFKLGTW